MNAAAVLLLGLTLGLVLFDVATRFKTNRRALYLEIAVFVGGAFFIMVPQTATWLAHRVGIGRGVDFLLYPIVIWLTRESLLNRRRHLESAARITELTRALAIATARQGQEAYRAAR
jgi:hypothetical protein